MTRWSQVLLFATVGLACTSSTSGTTPPLDAGPNAGFCSLDTDCPNTSRCRGGICQAAECVTREDCLSPLICTDGECVSVNPNAGCTNTAECPVSYLCDGFSRRCFNPDTGEFLGGGTSSSSGGGSSLAGSSSTGGVSSVMPGSSGGASSSSSSSSSSSTSGSGGLFDLGGWRVENRESGNPNQTTVIPTGTRVPRGGLLIIARDCSRREFEDRWGVTLDTNNVVFLNAANPSEGVPIVNGGEKFSLYNRSNQVEDGPTIVGSTSKAFRRTAAGSPGSQSSWDVVDDRQATPGVVDLPSGTSGVIISEWSDRSGNGEYFFEYIELYVNP